MIIPDCVTAGSPVQGEVGRELLSSDEHKVALAVLVASAGGWILTNHIRPCHFLRHIGRGNLALEACPLSFLSDTGGLRERSCSPKGSDTRGTR